MLSKDAVGGDVIIMELGADYTRESKTVTNSSGSTMKLTAGYPMDDNVPVIAANIANVDGLLLEPINIEDGETVKVAVLARGPAVVNKTRLPTKDYADASITWTAGYTALAALNIVLRTEPTKVEEQTT